MELLYQEIEKRRANQLDLKIEEFTNHIFKERFELNREDYGNLLRYYKRDKESSVDTEEDGVDSYRPTFDEVAERIMQKQPIITFDDTKELYIYKNGVYADKGAETTIKALAIEEYQNLLIEHEKQTHVPNSRFVSEALEYIRIYTHVFRDEIDNNQRHGYLINMANGIYNLKTHELTPHTPQFISLRQIPIKYDPEATCPHFIKFISEIVSPEDAQVLLEYIGYSLVQDMRFEKSVMLQGEGSNGKTILIKFIIVMHGESSISTTSLQRICEDRFAMAELYGKYLNVFPDMSGKMITEDEGFKGLTTGDMQTAQRKFGQPFQFRNQARQMYSVNKVPPVSDQSYAYFRRWILIKFPCTFKENPNPEKKNEKKKDKDLVSKLITLEELSGAFNLVP